MNNKFDVGDVCISDKTLTNMVKTYSSFHDAALRVCSARDIYLLNELYLVMMTYDSGELMVLTSVGVRWISGGGSGYLKLL